MTRNQRVLAAGAAVLASVIVGTAAVVTTVPNTPRLPGGVCAIDPADGERPITAAIASCPNGSTVRFPPNATYHQAGPIRIDDRHNLTIDGNGSTFNTTSTATVPGQGNFVVLRGTNITFERVTARGSFDLVPENGKYSLNFPKGIGWEANAGFGFFGTNGGGVRDSQTHHVWGDGVIMAFDGIIDDTVQCSRGTCNWQVSRNLVIERMVVDNASRTCWAPTNVQNIVIQDSLCKNAWMSAIDAEADGDHDGNVHNNLPIDGLKVLRNTFDGYNIAAIAVPVGGDTWQPNPADRTVVGNVEIRGNKILTSPKITPCHSPILIGLSGYDSRNRIRNVTLEDNDIAFYAVAVEFAHVDGGTTVGNRFHVTDLGLEGGPAVQCDPGRLEPVLVSDSTGITVADNG